MVSGRAKWAEWRVGGVKTRRGAKYAEEARKQKEDAKKEYEKMIRRIYREGRERPYLVRTGYIENGKPARKICESFVDRMICDTGTPGIEWRNVPARGNDHLLPSEKRDVKAVAYNTRARQCVCNTVRTDCDDIIKQIQTLTDYVLNRDILCGGGIREKLFDVQIFLQTTEKYVKQNTGNPRVALPDVSGKHEIEQWSLATHKACKALVHRKKVSKRERENKKTQTEQNHAN